MPKPDEVIVKEEEKDDDIVVVVQSDNTIKEKKEPVKDVKDDTIKGLEAKIDKLEKQANYAAGSYRLVEKLEKQIQDLVKQKSEKKDEEPVKTDEELTELFNKDIVAGTAEVVKRTLAAEKEKDKKEKELAEIRKEQTRQIEILETNKKEVLDKYPELADATSEYTKIWLEILDAHPEYKANYLGPILTMREMENEARRRGLKVKEEGIDANKIIDKEVNRRERVRQTNLKPGAKEKSGGGEVVLTQEQVNFCKYNNISLKDYAVTLRRLSGEQKVEV